MPPKPMYIVLWWGGGLAGFANQPFRVYSLYVYVLVSCSLECSMAWLVWVRTRGQVNIHPYIDTEIPNLVGLAPPISATFAGQLRGSRVPGGLCRNPTRAILGDASPSGLGASARDGGRPV